MRENRKNNSAHNSSYAVDVPQMADELRLQLRRYIEAQYPIRHPEIIAERQALLEKAGVISQEPFIESMPGYQPGPSYHELALPPLLTRALSEMASGSPPLIPARLYQHQADALKAMLHQDHDLIVVTGTGSGKNRNLPPPNPLAQHYRSMQASIKLQFAGNARTPALSYERPRKRSAHASTSDLWHTSSDGMVAPAC
jgi:hypothetical protein